MKANFLLNITKNPAKTFQGIYWLTKIEISSRNMTNTLQKAWKCQSYLKVSKLRNFTMSKTIFMSLESVQELICKTEKCFIGP